MTLSRAQRLSAAARKAARTRKMLDRNVPARRNKPISVSSEKSQNLPAVEPAFPRRIY